MPARTRKLSDADYERLADFRYALRCFLEFSESAAIREGLTPQQYQALLVIRSSPGANATVRRLADRLRIKHNTAVELAQRLEAGGLILRWQSPDDGRALCLTLTDEGEAKLELLAQVHRAELRQLSPEIVALFQSLETGEA
ncbi:MarR family winged helix-turn-helix transcriptional regulator [Luteolibacter luteus]|uniref:MarR family transcriptional regulator n=1 Tax=Luteolibacter luteus TaxID=2728835 RepID=A0A858RMM5_9BACT|nr:MarR family transcriptional regulator [Luteolibacter luteus]QJE97619.1 MarR family transcriptional regulator [Luteolibacter luteus]